MDHDAFIHAELERLAQAHIAANAADADKYNASNQPATATTTVAATLSDSLSVTPEVAASLLAASRSTLAADKQKEQTALVSVPAGLPGDWLFRLEPPLEIASKLETALDLASGSLQTIRASRTGEIGDEDDDVEFVFLEESTKKSLSSWLEKEAPGMQPLFVKLAKTTRGVGADGKRAVLEV